MTKNLIWFGLLLFWLTVFVFAIEYKLKAVMGMLPILAIGFLFFGVWVTKELTKKK